MITFNVYVGFCLVAAIMCFVFVAILCKTENTENTHYYNNIDNTEEEVEIEFEDMKELWVTQNIHLKDKTLEHEAKNEKPFEKDI